MCTTSSRTVPVRLGREPVRLQLERWNRLLAADLPVRDPVRAVDGLLRVHPQPGARGVRPGASTEEAVEHEITTTAGVVTSAAIVMVGVFFVFALMPILDMKEMGIGLAAAVLIDATIVRAVLLPASMKLLGDWNWYLPKWLEWLPRLETEPTPPSRPERVEAPVVPAS
jgi:MMPL family